MTSNSSCTLQYKPYKANPITSVKRTIRSRFLSPLDFNLSLSLSLSFFLFPIIIIIILVSASILSLFHKITASFPQ
ncbi:hypothetical protein GQ457_09G004810 [Hibiscus cannabinus]